MSTNKAPGPDGFPVEFFTANWHTVGEDFCGAVRNFFLHSTMPRSWKDTFVALIPKNQTCNLPEHFRPISLCNVVYKTVSKILVNRLKPFMPRLVSREQAAFVSGRDISDNILLAQEAVHSMEYDGFSGKTMALKLDMAQAYDRMSWEFICAVLSRMDFGRVWIGWILACISNPSFSILINGSPSTWFSSSRGLRQGDPLAPFLFILGADVLTRNLNRLQDSGTLSGICPMRGGSPIQSLSFADDGLLFSTADDGQCRSIAAAAVRDYCRNFGQLVNTAKSAIIFGKTISIPIRGRICGQFGIAEANEPFRYLGISIWGKRIPMSSQTALLNSVLTRISGWKVGLLSFAGRVTLIKSVLVGLPQFALANSYVSSGVLMAIEKTIRQFLWVNPGTRKGIHLFKWDSVCRPRIEGGLDIRRLAPIQQAMMGRKVHDLMGNKDSLWVKFFRGKYRVPSNLWEWYCGERKSWVCRAVSMGLSVVRDHAMVSVARTGVVEFWSSPWFYPVPLSRWPTFLNINFVDQSLYVQDFMDINFQWLEDDLLAIIHLELLKMVIDVPILFTQPDRPWVWGPNVKSRFSSREAFVIASKLDVGLSVPLTPLWGRFWIIPAPPRVLHFGWKLLKGRLPTLDVLMRKNIVSSPRCSRCLTVDEDADNDIFNCPVAALSWMHFDATRSGGRVLRSSVEFSSFIMADDGELRPDAHSNHSSLSSRRLGHLRECAVMLTFIWELWTARNRFIFDSIALKPEALVRNTWNLVADLLSASMLVSSTMQDSGHVASMVGVQWASPEFGKLKLNFDGAVTRDGSRILAGAGYTIRDSRGALIRAGSIPLSNPSVPNAEIRGLWEGVKAILDVDCLGALDLCDRVQISHIYREDNQAADWMATRAKMIVREEHFTSEFPTALLNLAHVDMSSCIFQRFVIR